MRRTREFRDIFFDAESIEKAFTFFDKSLLTDLHKRYLVKEFVIEIGELSWEFDTEDKLLEAYIPGITTIIYKKTFLDYEFMLYTGEHSSYVGLKAQTLAKMVPIFRYVESLVPSGALTREQALKKARPLILVLHTKNGSWKELVSYLYITHGLAIKPLELNRSNQALMDEIITMAGKDNLAVFVFPGEGGESQQEDYNLIRHISGMVGNDRIILVYSEKKVAQSLPLDIEKIEFRQGHIKQVFWLILNMIRKRFKEEHETQHSV